MSKERKRSGSSAREQAVLRRTRKKEEDILEQLEEGAGDEPQGDQGGGQKEQAAGNGDGDQGQAAAGGGGENADEGVVFRVTGDPGQKFQGSLALTDTQRSVQGVTPRDFPLKGIDDGILSSDIVSGNAQKSQAGNATLTVQVLVDGEVAKKASTSAEYGVAQVTWSASE